VLYLRQSGIIGDLHESCVEAYTEEITRIERLCHFSRLGMLIIKSCCFSLLILRQVFTGALIVTVTVGKELLLEPLSRSVADEPSAVVWAGEGQHEVDIAPEYRNRMLVVR
jgi:hypothetical protein